MKFVSAGVIVVLLLSLVAATTTQPAATQPTAPANKKCPVSGEDVNPKGKTVIYKGKVVGFCNTGCRDKFEAATRAFDAKIEGK